MGNKINLRQQLPMQNMERILFCQAIKEIGVGKIEQLHKEHHVFLMPIQSGEGTSYHEIDWEFVLFEATSHQMNKLLECFMPPIVGSKIILEK